MKLLKIDLSTGKFIEDVIVDEVPTIIVDDVEVQDPQYVTVPSPNGFYLPKWNGSAWVEGLTKTQIDVIKNQPVIPTMEDKLKALEAENVLLKERLSKIENTTTVKGELSKIVVPK